MNLITDPWIPVIRQNGDLDTISPWQIAEKHNPVIEIKAPRPDFQGALYQFLIGLLQTCFAPEDEDEWLEYWQEIPPENELQDAFLRVKDAFELESKNGPAFMQENPSTAKHKQLFDKTEWLPVEDLVGGALSENTRKGNKDLFVKAGNFDVLSPYWAALALFNLQTTGVLAWGKHRVGLRGNAPLTTILISPEQDSLLWKNLWLNMLYDEDLDLIPGDLSKKEKKDIFPWMDSTRISPHKKPATSPQDANPLQHYWPMPRRIILKVEEVEDNCALSGIPLKKGVKYYKRVPDGIYYTNGWNHPLTPHARTTKVQFPKPIEGKCAGEGFRQWVSLNYDEFSDVEDKRTRWGRALVVQHYYEEKPRVVSPKLWCFGYDATNANVKCWYESIMPTFSVKTEDITVLRDHVSDALQLASLLIDELRTSLARAWFRPQIDSSGKKKWNQITSRMKKAKHLSSYNNIEYEYWDYLETIFPTILDEFIYYKQQTGRPFHIHDKWAKNIQEYSLQYFDQNTLNRVDDTSGLKQVVEAKKYLLGALYPTKKSFLKDINEFRKQQKESIS